MLTICPAVLNGGVTTFLALAVLAGSNSHAFITFFKVFFLTVVFGLFHGVVFLPVILSWIGGEKKETEREAPPIRITMMSKSDKNDSSTQNIESQSTSSTSS